MAKATMAVVGSGRSLRFLVLCDRGHVLESVNPRDPLYLGSRTEVLLSELQEGKQSHYHKMAACCQGEGH